MIPLNLQPYMLIEPPIPMVFIGLQLFLPGIGMLCSLLLDRFISDLYEKTVFGLGAALATWLLMVHAMSLASHSFIWGVLVGTLIPGMSGYLLYFCSGKPAIRFTFYRGHIIAALLCTAIILPSVLFWDFHDEIGHYGVHFSFANEILNNVYPPRDFIFADQPLRYHYGIDTLFAMVMAVTRLPVDYAIDVVSIALWLYMLLLYGMLGKTLFAQSNSSAESSLWQPAIYLGAFAAGLPFLSNSNPSFLQLLASISSINGSLLNPPLTSNFLQHAWALGFPFGLLSLFSLRQLEVGQKDSVCYAVILGLSLAVLSISNMTLFIVLAVSFSLWYGWLFLQSRLKNQPTKPAGLILCTIISVLCLAYFISGFRDLLIGNPYTPHAHLIPDVFSNGGNAWDALRWHLATLGLLIPVGFVSMSLYRQMLPVFTLVIFFSLLILNCFRYEASWDIVKFATVVELMLAIQAAGVLLQWKPTRLMAHFSKGLVFSVLIAWGIFFHIPFLFDIHGHWDSNRKEVWQASVQQGIGLDDIQAINWLRKKIKPEDIVLCEPGSMFYVYFGGFPQLWADQIDPALGFADDMIARRKMLITEYQPDATVYLQNGVRWAIARKQTNGGQHMLPYLEQWTYRGQAHKSATFGSVVIYKLQK